MEKYTFVDSNRGSSSSHSIEARSGFSTLAHAMLEKSGNEWWVYDVYTKPEHRGKGIQKAIIAHIEQEYGPIAIESENPDFWYKMGYSPCKDGFWRKHEEKKM